ncbi:MAG: DsbA family protein [Acidobacteriota bacterium]|nr:DsbA family protein [Acidobacteriota bacterium]
MQKYRPFLIIAAVLAVAIIGTVRLLRWQRSKEAFTSVQSTPRPTSQEPKLPGGVVITLEEFGDYQCPPCGALHPTLKKLKQEFGANLNFVFRNLPLSVIHKNALAAAQAAEAARVQDRFWQMHDLLYENQDLWKDDINPRAIFIKFASDLGLDTARFVHDLDDQQVLMRIEADKEAAASLGINGTPTILIDGRRLRDEVTTPEGVRKGIEVMMARKSSPEP